MRLIAVTDEQFATIRAALHWYSIDASDAEAGTLHKMLDRPPSEVLHAAGEAHRKLKAVASAAFDFWNSAPKVTTMAQVIGLQKLGDTLVEYNGAPLSYKGALNLEGEAYDEPASEG